MPYVDIENIENIENILPQTQCTQCGYNGCRPYAQAIADGDDFNKCTPGGQKVIARLARLLQRKEPPAHPEHLPDFPAHTVTVREPDCIGCTKCIQACPVDAIIGAAGQMHTVLNLDCTGCDLCISSCPTDCIEKVPLESDAAESLLTSERIVRNRFLYERRLQRLEKQKNIRAARRQHILSGLSGKKITGTSEDKSAADNSQLVLLALHAQEKKTQRQVQAAGDPESKSRLLSVLNGLRRQIKKIEEAGGKEVPAGKMNSHNGTVQLAVLRSKLKRLQQRKKLNPLENTEDITSLNQQIQSVQEQIERLLNQP